MDWLLKRLSDGTGQTNPREIILFLNESCKIQAERLERGDPEPAGSALFEAGAFKDALAKVSEYRVTRVLYSEYPDLRKYFEALERQKCEHDIGSLSNVWNLPLSQTEITANTLIKVGFFERRIIHGKQTYWIPFLYRPHLKLVQGKQLQAA